MNFKGYLDTKLLSETINARYLAAALHKGQAELATICSTPHAREWLAHIAFAVISLSTL